MKYSRIEQIEIKMSFVFSCVLRGIRFQRYATRLLVMYLYSRLVFVFLLWYDTVSNATLKCFGFFRKIPILRCSPHKRHFATISALNMYTLCLMYQYLWYQQLSASFWVDFPQFCWLHMTVKQMYFWFRCHCMTDSKLLWKFGCKVIIMT